MRTTNRRRFTQVLALACLTLLAGASARAQTTGSGKSVNPAFSNVNAAPPAGSPVSGAASVGSLQLPSFGLVSTSSANATIDAGNLGRNWRAFGDSDPNAQVSNAGWAVPIVGFGNATSGQRDIRDQARSYVKQKLLLEILSRSALGRGLSKFIDPGEAPFGATDTSGQRIDRSRLLPFISPKLDVGDRKVAVSLIWKF